MLSLGRVELSRLFSLAGFETLLKARDFSHEATATFVPWCVFLLLQTLDLFKTHGYYYRRRRRPRLVDHSNPERNNAWNP